MTIEITDSAGLLLKKQVRKNHNMFVSLRTRDSKNQRVLDKDQDQELDVRDRATEK